VVRLEELVVFYSRLGDVFVRSYMNENAFPTLKSEGHNYAVNGRNAKGNHPPILRKIAPCTSLMTCRRHT